MPSENNKPKRPELSKPKGSSPLAGIAADTIEDWIVEDAEPVLGSASGGPRAFREIALHLDLNSLVQIVKASTMRELNVARDNAKTYRAFARAFGPFAQQVFGTARAFPWLVAAQTTDLTLAYTIPAIVLIQRLNGPTFTWTMSFLATWTPYFAAASILLDQLPAELRVVGRPGGYDSLTPSQLEQFKGHLDRFEVTHPDELALLENPPAIPEHLG